MAWQKLTLRFTGASPLMQHNPDAMIKMRDYGQGKKGDARIPSAEIEASWGVYQNGTYYHPAEAFRDAIIDSSSGYKFGKRFASATFKSALMISQEHAELFDPETDEPLDGYKVDTRRVVVQGNGIQRSRPRFERWATELEFEYDDDLLTPEVILEFANLAGKFCGIGEYRPKPPSFSRGRGGPFGRFTAEVVAED